MSVLCSQLVYFASTCPKKKSVIVGSIGVKQTGESQISIRDGLYTNPHSPEERSDQTVTHVGVQPVHSADRSSVNSESLCNDLKLDSIHIDRDESVKN